MRRREFIGNLIGTAVAWPLAASAQQLRKIPRIGVLWHVSGAEEEVFAQALEHLGWTEGRNLLIDYRRFDDADRARALAKELVSLPSDLIVVWGTTPLEPVRQETRTIPIVFVGLTDPAGRGFVESLARPGGNITGFADEEAAMMATKRLELLKEIAPGVARVAVIFNQKFHPLLTASYLRSLEAAAPSFAVKVIASPVPDDPELERTIAAAGREPNGGLLVVEDAYTHSHSELITALAAQHRLPAIYPFPGVTESGGLLSYSVDYFELLRQAAGYIDRILKGAKPADLPVQQPTKYQLFINLKTAKDLNLTVPRSLLVLVDKMIE
jgi:putative ABC transport system substrate-binding protein